MTYPLGQSLLGDARVTSSGRLVVAILRSLQYWQESADDALVVAKPSASVGASAFF